jgi:cytochrome P450
MTTADQHEPVTAPAFPMARRCPFGPPPEYEALREAAPVVRVEVPSGAVIWAVTRHAEAQQVLSDRGAISTDTSRPDFPQLRGEAPGEEERAAMAAFHRGMFIDMDPPEHDTLRRMVISEFSVRRIAAMRPGIQRTVDAALDAMVEAGPPADLVAAFGLPVPSLVICQLLGVPYADREYFQSRTRRVATLNQDPSIAQRAMLEIREYLDGLITSTERAPGDDLIGRLVTGPLAGGTLTHDELVGMALLMLVAGFETTANMIPLSALTLLEHPVALAELRADPSLWPAAVEELLRFHSIVDWAAFDRMAVRDTEIGGQPVRAGDGVYVLGASANRDPRVFAEPDEFDLHRGARNHVAFGYGVHQCLGQNLARAELEIALRTLVERLPELRLATALDDVPIKHDAAIFGLYELPVRW